jgi:uncharacterized membrane protein YhaH (DUF805 family)
MKWFFKALNQYGDFTSRASRKEYWCFTICSLLLGIITIVADNIIDLNFVIETEYKTFQLPYGYIYSLYIIIMLIPSLAVTVRRLHDTGKSGWRFFIILIPFLGGILLLINLLQSSEIGSNRWGETPKESLAFL